MRISSAAGPMLLRAVQVAAVAALLVSRSTVAMGQRASSDRPAEANRSALARDPRVGWLRQYASPIRTIDPADTAYSDLAPVRTAIGDARIVMLGESSHGDGTTFLAKTRLIKFLHERMGFDVLVWEAGLYDVGKGWELIRGGESATKVLPDRVYTIWTGVQEGGPLLQYVEQRARSSRPLEMAGVDNKFSGRAAGDGFIADLSAALTAQGMSAARVQPGSVLEQGFRSLLPREPQSFPEDVFIDSLTALRRDVAEAMRRERTPTAAQWSRILAGLDEYARDLRIQRDLPRTRPDTAEYVRWRNMRDVQMGRNLIWLAEEKFAGRKLIVWAATGHLSYSQPFAPGRGFLTMGAVAKEVLGPQLYQIDFISYSGSAFNPFMAELYGNKPFELERTPSGDGLEELLNASGRDLGFINLRDIRRGGQWLHELQWARPQGHTPMRARWPEHTDAFFFIREMRPASALREDQRKRDP